MPRRSADGGKPFELRTGIGGLPDLGGMFRSGDPATIPPHKFHLLANMRRTPGGLVTRPGLELVHDTGVQECIDGVTEDGDQHAGELLLWSGAVDPTWPNPPTRNPATFRAVFDYQANDYSEFIIVLYGGAAATRGTLSPVVAFNPAGVGSFYVGPTTVAQPFIFRGQACQFAEVDRDGVPTMALLGMSLPPRSLLQASDCWRNPSGPVGDPLCPGQAGQQTPPGDEPPIWPFQHPVGSAEVITYFDNPDGFAPGAWTLDVARALPFLVLQERSDDPVSAAEGTIEVLYFIATQGALIFRLIRWDGVRQTTEYAIPVAFSTALGQQIYGPILGMQDVSGGAADWAALRGQDGSWSVIGGAGYTLANPAGADDYSYIRGGGSLVYESGRAHMLLYGLTIQGAPTTTNAYIHMHPQAATEFTALRSAPSCTLWELIDGIPWEMGIGQPVVLGNLCYAIGWIGTTPSGLAGHASLWIGDFSNPTTQWITEVAPPLGLPGIIRLGNAEDRLKWIQVVGNRVYVGGKFDLNPITLAADGIHHGVYDVTEVQTKEEIREVYRVNATAQTYDAVAERYSIGCLEAAPSDYAGEGFGES